MKWKKVFGWLLLACGILWGLYVFLPTISYALQALGSILEILDSNKTWGLIGAAIFIWAGWTLAHRGKQQ